MTKKFPLLAGAAVVAALMGHLATPSYRPAAVAAGKSEKPALIKSARSGPWSKAETWDGGKVPAAGQKVLICEGHAVVYDVKSDAVVRSLHVSGTLRFATDRDTRLDVGLIKVQPGEDTSEEGFDCEAHQPERDAKKPRPALEVGTPDDPVGAKHTALIRLVYQDGMDKESCPAIVCCGGRMDFHGQPMNRTWVKLGAKASADDKEVTLAEAVEGWRVGDRVIVPTTDRPDLFDPKGKKFIATVRDTTRTEERTVKAVEGRKLTLDRPLAHDHRCEGDYRGEVANLSRNVVVESAAPDGVRGHTMYHRGSAGSISYAEFRHLGKKGVLGRYSLHYHLCRDTMRGSYVLGASIHDSHNRWITVHGTEYLVVRDCVGYNSVGHGYFLEDGTEVFNVFDRNLAVQACRGEPLPKQVLPFDDNTGAGFWWANSLNTFTRNVAVECDQYGYRYEAEKSKDFDPVLKVPQPDGSRKAVDVRTLPFVRFEGNEARSQRRFGLNLGGIRGVSSERELRSGRDGRDMERVKGGHVGGVGPDRRHPFVVRDFRVWASHWAFHGGSPNVMIDGMDVYDGNYGIWRSRVDGHEYRGLRMSKLKALDIYNPWGGDPEVGESYDRSLQPKDDLPPTTVITRVTTHGGGKLTVRGTTADDAKVKKVVVNGEQARATRSDFAEWEVELSGLKAGELKVSAHSEDEAGNVEKRPHAVTTVVR